MTHRTDRRTNGIHPYIYITGAAIAFAIFALGAVRPAAAQTCPYNSTQTGGPTQCTCPTSGPGVSCVGGQLYSSSTSSCYNDPRPCATNQVMNCATGQCACNTSLYPCGGCTAPTSTPGGSCSSPTGGQYTNQCGSCGCPVGTQLCGASNTCVAVIACPAGTSFDPCTNSCSTPNVLLSPSWDQSGNIRITGNITSTAGDVYLANGKAIRVDGAGVTDLNIGNWGTGGTAANLNLFGSASISGTSTVTGNSNASKFKAAAGNAFDKFCMWGSGDTQYCIGMYSARTFGALNDYAMTFTMNADADRGFLWRDASDAANDGAMSLSTDGKLTVKDYVDAAQLCIGGDCKNGWDEFLGGDGSNPLVIRNAADTADVFVVDPTGVLTVGNVPWARLSGFPSACPGGQFVTGVGGTLACAAPSGVTGSGTSNYVTKFTAASSVGDSQLYDNGTNVGIGTTTPAQKLDVVGTVRATSFVTSSGATLQPVPTGTSGQTLRHNGTAWAADSNLFNNGTNVGIGTATPSSTLSVSGQASIASSAVSGSALSVSKSGTGNAYGIYVTTAASGNAISALRAINNGAGPGIEVNGGSNAAAANIRGGGDNRAIDAAVYDHSSANTLETVITVRRGTTGTPATGMGGALSWALEGSGGSHYSGGQIGFVWATPSSTTDFVIKPAVGSSPTERLRVTSDGKVGIGTSAPAYDLDVNGYLNVASGIGANHAPTAGYGIWAEGSTMGGRFRDTGGTSYSYVAYGGYGLYTPYDGYFGGNQTVGGNLTVDTSTLYVDSATNEVGVLTTDPRYDLHVRGSIGTGWDWGVGGSVTFRPSDGYAWFHIDNGYGNPYPARSQGELRLSHGSNPGDNPILSLTQGGSAKFFEGRANDTSYEWLGFYSGSTRQGIIIYDGSWDGCAGDTSFCIKAEQSNDLNLKAGSGYVNSLSYFTAPNAAFGAASISAGYGVKSSGTTMGGYFYDESPDGSSAYMYAGYDRYGTYGYSSGPDARGVYGRGYNATGSGSAYGGYFDADDNGGPTSTGVYAAGDNWGIWAESTGSSGGMAGVVASGPSGAYDFLANGAGTNYGASSSVRWKRNIRPIDSPLDKVLDLRGVYFDWDEEHGGQHDVGMIAEEVREVLPEIVVVDPDDDAYASGMDYSMLTPLLVEAVKEQQEQIRSLEERIEGLEALLSR